MKIAVASGDGVSMSQHIGQSTGFIIFEVEGKEIKSSEWRAARQDWLCPCPPLSPAGIISDCKIVLCGGMGSGAAQSVIEQGLEPVTIRTCGDAREILSGYLNGKLEATPSVKCRYQAL
ncbi:MAG: hypothetical protein CXZ00_10495 [Acidobacteria bacterium]|nr:MAG: hypothetical protein CXZ00_10495 [Acidobacteriota bacterium]